MITQFFVLLFFFIFFHMSVIRTTNTYIVCVVELAVTFFYGSLAIAWADRVSIFDRYIMPVYSICMCIFIKRTVAAIISHYQGGWLINDVVNSGKSCKHRPDTLPRSFLKWTVTVPIRIEWNCPVCVVIKYLWCCLLLALIIAVI